MEKIGRRADASEFEDILLTCTPLQLGPGQVLLDCPDGLPVPARQKGRKRHPAERFKSRARPSRQINRARRASITRVRQGWKKWPLSPRSMVGGGHPCFGTFELDPARGSRNHSHGVGGLAGGAAGAGLADSSGTGVLRAGGAAFSNSFFFFSFLGFLPPRSPLTMSFRSWPIMRSTRLLLDDPASR